MAATPYDAIVIGSGISGGWAAKELCEKGLKTLVLERGRPITHIKDYTDSTKDPWELPHRGSTTTEDAFNSPIQSQKGAYNEVSKKFFVNDRQNPYVQVKPFDWIRGYQVGGRSLIWGRQCYRWSDLDFEANARDGHGVDWPIRYKDIERWYDYVEPFVGISGSMEGLPQLPDGKFLPPMELNCMEKEVAERIKNHYTDGRRLIIGRTANHTARVGDRGPCQFRDRCNQGCVYSGYFSSNAATLPAAVKTGNLTIRPFSIVQEIIYDKDKQKATGVRVVDAETLQTHEFYSKIIFLNASTLGTAFVLLNSVSDAFPDGLGNSSGQIGHNLMDHHDGDIKGHYEGLKDRYIYGRRPTGIIIPRFRNINEQTRRKDYVRGFQYLGGAGRDVDSHIDGIGPEFKEQLTEPGDWTMRLEGYGETLPYYENKVSLNKDQKDAFGLPVLNIDCEWKENEKIMFKDMMDSAAEMLELSGVKNIRHQDRADTPGNHVHEMGTARMGRDPKTSVLNEWNQMHDVKNVFITDGACMTSSACQNPSLTYMALTARAADYAVKELKKGNLG
ncbi:MAG: GMC family oxidoreductase [Bacteroidota bacterium]|nr:GMC family oxidoreductase [Bacteroidota bacterium]